MIFAGAITVNNDGQEDYASFSQHATPDTESHYLTTFGVSVPIPNTLFGGTSAAAPIIAGSFALLNQYLKQNLNQSIPTDSLLMDLHDSGHEITHNEPTPI